MGIINNNTVINMSGKGIRFSPDHKSYVGGQITRCTNASKRFRELFANLPTKEVVNKMMCKVACVDEKNFPKWKEGFLAAVGRMKIKKVEELVGDLDGMVSNIIYEDYSKAVMKERRFNYEFGGESSIFSIFLGSIMMPGDKFEIAYTWKMLSWTLGSNYALNSKYWETSDILDDGMKYDILMEFQNELFY